MKSINQSEELKKHSKYRDKYKKDDLYWGIGIENEIYLEFDKAMPISNKFFLNNHKRERYSVDYYSSYYMGETTKTKKNCIKQAFLNYNIPFSVPVLINAHSFTCTDSNNEPRTLYTKKCENNPKFKGRTLLDDILAFSPVLKESYEKEWLFDGDTIEFTTLNFYNAQLQDVTIELEQYKQSFQNEIQNYQRSSNLFKDLGEIRLMSKNHPFSIHLTNKNNLAMFNNGTLHYNLTLPTQLDSQKRIANPQQFIAQHKMAIRMIQWMEPFFIAVYNTPDPFFGYTINTAGKKPFSNCSQRCALSRYIGIGTYDTDIMKTGKQLTIPISTFSQYPFWWYTRYHETSAYNQLSDVGLDINFNKHYNHGIELRFFDHITDLSKVTESFEMIIYLMDFVLEQYHLNKHIENPIYQTMWNDIVLKTMKDGKDAVLTLTEKKEYEMIFEYGLQSTTIHDIYYELFAYLRRKYTKIVYLKNNTYMYEQTGLYSKYTLLPKRIDISNEEKNACPIISVVRVNNDVDLDVVKESETNSEMEDLIDHVEEKEDVMGEQFVEQEKNGIQRLIRWFCPCQLHDIL